MTGPRSVFRRTPPEGMGWVEGTKESVISVFLVVLFYVLTNVTTVDYASTFAKSHSTRVTQYIITRPWGVVSHLCVTDYEFIISPPPKSLSRRSSAIYFACISVRVYLYISILFICFSHIYK